MSKNNLKLSKIFMKQLGFDFSIGEELTKAYIPFVVGTQDVRIYN